MKHIFLILVLSSVLFGSCKKDNSPDCFQPNGAVLSFPISFGQSITELEIRDDISVFLSNSHPDSTSFLLCNEFLESEISLKIRENKLVLENLNQCNWVRKSPKIEVHLFLDNISRVNNLGSAGLKLKDYNVPTFTYDQRESLASNVLNVQTDTLSVNLHVLSGTAILSGTSNHSNLYANGITQILDNGFSCNTASVNNSSYKDIYISVQEYMFGFIGNEGNIYYNHEGLELGAHIEGNGEVIYKEF